MGYLLRALRLVGMVVWVGGLIFFAFIEAPTAFHVMGITREFALLIGGSVAGINHLGRVSGVVFVLASILLWKRSTPLTRKLLGIEIFLAFFMVLVTAYVQMRIVPAMERDRAAVGGDINSVPADNPIRAHFDRLHAASERAEGSALFLGLTVVLLMAAEDIRRDMPGAVTR